MNYTDIIRLLFTSLSSFLSLNSYTYHPLSTDTLKPINRDAVWKTPEIPPQINQKSV